MTTLSEGVPRLSSASDVRARDMARQLQDSHSRDSERRVHRTRASRRQRGAQTRQQWQRHDH
eukprot:176193-Pleurochrysis_carterae.AAC.2